MIQEMRNPKALKWMMWVILIVTIPSFVLFYGFSDTGGGPRYVTGPMVTVEKPDGEEVKLDNASMDRAKNDLLNYYLRMAMMSGYQGDNLRQVQGALQGKLDLRDTARWAIGDVALEHRFEQERIRVTDKQVSMVLKDQGMTRQELQSFLEREGIDEYEYAIRVKSNLHDQLAQNTVNRAARTSLLELWQEYLLANEELTVSFVEIPIEADESYEPTDENLREIYDELVEDENRLVIEPEKVIYDYIAVPAPPRQAPIPNQIMLRERYDETPDDDPELFQEGGYRVRHLMTETREEAAEARERIVDGGDMRDIADEVTIDIRNLYYQDENSTPTLRGGLLAQTLRGTQEEVDTWGQQYVEWMTSSELDDLSPVMETPQGYAVARIEQVIEEGKMPFNQAVNIIRNRVVEELKAEYDAERDAQIADTVQMMREALAMSTTLEGVARQAGLQVKQTSPTLTTSYFITGVGNFQRESDSIDALVENGRGMTPVLQSTSGDVAILRLAPENVFPESVKPFETVKDQLIDRARRRAASREAEQMAEELRASVSSDDVFTSAAIKMEYEVTNLDPFPRQEVPQELRRAPEITRRILPANEGDILIVGVGPEDFRSAYYVVSIDDVNTPSQSAFLEDMQQLEQQMLFAKRQAFVEEFRKDAVEQYPVELNEDFFDDTSQL